MKILFIGNSYTYYNDLDVLFKNLAQENGQDVHADRVTKGGRRLEEFKDAEDETTGQLMQLLQTHSYDVCVIQEQSLLPAVDYERFLDGVKQVAELVGDRGGQFILYATWGRKAGNPTLSEQNWTPEQMTELLSDAYHRAAEEIHARVSPVGVRFLQMIRRFPETELYDKDGSHPSYMGSCLAALTHYCTVFGTFPENTASLQLSEPEIGQLRAVLCP